MYKVIGQVIVQYKRNNNSIGSAFTQVNIHFVSISLFKCLILIQYLYKTNMNLFIFEQFIYLEKIVIQILIFVIINTRENLALICLDCMLCNKFK